MITIVCFRLSEGHVTLFRHAHPGKSPMRLQLLAAAGPLAATMSARADPLTYQVTSL